ncbi:MAG TPA: xanthine dehydrogenase family protein subunit M [Gemmatimonadales bacterium]|nr:xanthine dehydrogenase family protein subunit M [Gemmatimonadales bacterium]
MIPAAFDYVRAKTLNDALKALGKNAKVIAGGHSLLPLMRFRLAQPDLLIDIGYVPQLKGIKRAGGGLRIGATTTYRELLESQDVRALYPLIAEVTEHIGDLQVRNAGTIGGGLAHADPAADMPPVMLVLDATFVLQSKTAKRSVAARKFFKGPFATALKPTELLTEIQLPAPPAGAGTAYASFDQAASGYALAGAAALVARAQGKIVRADLAFTGLADTPFLAAAATKLVGTTGDAGPISEVAAAAVAGVEANEDIHASAEYRRHLAEVAARRALAKAVAGAR